MRGSPLRVGIVLKSASGSCSSGWSGEPFCDLTLQPPRLLRQLLSPCLQQIGIEAAAMFDRFQSVGADPQRDRLAKRIADEVNLAKIGQKPPLRLVVGMTHGMADKDTLSRQFATPCHRKYSENGQIERAPIVEATHHRQACPP